MLPVAPFDGIPQFGVLVLVTVLAPPISLSACSAGYLAIQCDYGAMVDM